MGAVPFLLLSLSFPSPTSLIFSLSPGPWLALDYTPSTGGPRPLACAWQVLGMEARARAGLPPLHCASVPYPCFVNIVFLDAIHPSLAYGPVLTQAYPGLHFHCVLSEIPQQPQEEA